MVRRLVATGCGRSGTQYLTKLFQTLGVRAVHEKVFLIGNATTLTRDTLPGLYDEKGIDIDVSWFAAPRLHHLPDDWGLVHLVRNPVRVIRSWRAHGLWERGMGSVAVSWVAAHLGWPPTVVDDPLEASIRYWIGWNQIVLDSYSWAADRTAVHVETLSQLDAVKWLMGRIGAEWPGDGAERWRGVPKDVGATKYLKPVGAYKRVTALDPSIRWETFPQWARDDIAPLAAMFGYTCKQLQEA